MKTIILVSTLLTLLLQCNGDISGSVNQPLPLNSLTRIPTPTQSLLPPTFENPIKDYTVGLVPPPIEGSAARVDAKPKFQQHQTQPRKQIHSNSYTRTSGFINTARPFVNSVQQQSGYSAVHQRAHQSPNLLQPQAYQPKTAIQQPFQQFIAQQQPHYSPPTTYSAGIVRPPVAQHQQHKHFVSAPQYYDPGTQRRVHQHSTHTHYVSIPLQRAAAGLQHAYPSVPISSAFVPRPVSSSVGTGSIIQTYPSVAYEAIPQYGSTLNFGNARLDPELVQIISDVYGQYH